MQYDEVKELIQIFEKSDLNDMELKLDNATIRLNRGAVSPWAGQQIHAMDTNTNDVSHVSSNIQSVNNISVENSTAENISESLKEASEVSERFVKAPIVGTFYESSSPENPSFVKVGDEIKNGDVVCIIEAMKFMNEVTSEESGKIAEILVEDGQFVEYGQPLFRIE